MIDEPSVREHMSRNGIHSIAKSVPEPDAAITAGTNSRKHFETIALLIDEWANQKPEAFAVLAPDRPPLTYRQLHQQVQSIVATLNATGIGRNDRVAIVVPNGPELAVTFLGVAAGATSAPLNPAYRADEFRFYLTDLGVKALIVQQDTDSPARAVAAAHGIPVIELIPVRESAAGTAVLTGQAMVTPTSLPAYALPDDVALVLHTSGTTSRPKIVPLTQANVCTSAHNVAASLALTSADRCLNVMPLFHVHGLVAAVLASLAAGGSLICAPGLHAPDFLEWVAALQPTWYTAVPTMHQAILARARQQPERAARSGLRLIRSASAPLPPIVLSGLEQCFRVPVIEAYGMTEAAHQIASNPLPPAQRKPGSVGRAAGPQVAIMDTQGQRLPAGQLGEIVIRGPNVTSGYANSPTAHQEAFVDGWLRTGDQGVLDEEGYLFINGRIKEIINRGGEKIAPREVDEVILEHPAVAQAITFAVPDARLGEAVAVAVVLQPNAELTSRALRQFAAARLADFKVPQQVIMLEELPKGPTGKPQRIGLAKVLGVTGEEPASQPALDRPPATPLECVIAEVWAAVLQVALSDIGAHTSFLQLGGDSVLATQVVLRVQDIFGIELPLIEFLEEPTIAGLALLVTQHQLQHLDPADAASLLDEVANLSEDEIHQL